MNTDKKAEKNALMALCGKYTFGASKAKLKPILAQSKPIQSQFSGGVGILVNPMECLA
jgi:hypothetical protein